MLVIAKNCNAQFDLVLFCAPDNKKLETSRCLCISDATEGGSLEIGRGRRDVELGMEEGSVDKCANEKQS